MNRIVTDPAICAGKPVIRGTRILVQVLRDMVASGCTTEQVLATYPELNREDVAAALTYSPLLDQ
jgi:uncharacterized protein (DUF433 family)